MRITGNRAEAEDAVQEVLLRMVRSIHRLDPQPSLRPWLRRVATNVCIDQAGRAERGGGVQIGNGDLTGLADQAALATFDSDPVGQQVVERAQIAAVSAAMEGLGRTQRSVLLLRVVEGMSYDAISTVLGLPIGTIKSHLSRARSQLRRALPDSGSN
jgi:RNA polymerase sigma-70 factor (ECF subfamily)